MASPVSVPLIHPDLRPARPFRRIITGCVFLLAAAASACTKPGPGKPVTNLARHPWTVMGEGLPLCTPAMTSGAAQVIRIFVFQSLDKIFDPAAVQKPIFYGSLPETPDFRVAHDFAPGALARLKSTDSAIESNVYHSDITDTGTNLMAPALVEFRVILENGLGSSTTAGNMKYYSDPQTAGSAIRGVTVNKSDLPDFLCSNEVIDESNAAGTTTHAIVDFYAHLNPRTVSWKYDGFNVILVPKSANTTTPVMIDPKIRNY